MQANRRARYQPLLIILTMCLLRVASFNTSVRMIKAASFEPPSTPATKIKTNDELTVVTAVYMPSYGYRPFSPWGGKRHTSVLGNIDNDRDWNQDPSDTILPTREFEASGGKRSISVEIDDDIDHDYIEKRQFKPWGGKRNSVFSVLKHQSGLFGEKGRCNAWRGKKEFNPSEGKNVIY
ncbi:uncharacterized protein LOC143248382 [Tachypleus tridentatus]|uniref:uncharacterized protein LOC143248382 n=1 Tax=Tachypleus tridentatus TaxID=6853 RepID=UPI003FD04BC2